MSNEEIFKEYVCKFDISKEAIDRKLWHSLRVSKLCGRIAKSLDLDDELVNLAEFIGLIHDIGRFTQWEKYHTYNDFESENHAILGVNILKNGLINRFNISDNWYDVIFSAVKCHNMRFLDNTIKGNYLLMAKIVRDADKIDILYLTKINSEDNLSVSKEVEKEFLDKKTINRLNVNNKTDEILMRLAFVFDLNYSYSLDYLKKMGYIENLYNSLKYKDVIRPYYEFILKVMGDKNGEI